MTSCEPFCGIKLTDFGLAKLIGNTGTMLKTICGTFNYLAPEILRSRKSGYTTSVDCWSLGVTLFVMLSGRLPFPDSEDMIEKSAAQDPDSLDENHAPYAINFDPAVWSATSLSARDLTQRLLELDPALRLSVDSALGHTWIKKQENQLNLLYLQVASSEK